MLLRNTCAYFITICQVVQKIYGSCIFAHLNLQRPWFCAVDLPNLNKTFFASTKLLIKVWGKISYVGLLRYRANLTNFARRSDVCTHARTDDDSSSMAKLCL